MIWYFCILFWRSLFIATKELQINEEIRDKEVRVITDDGEQLGVMSAADALKAASYRSLDLVKIAPQAVPPVCKIMDYGKYRFDQQKREKVLSMVQSEIYPDCLNRTPIWKPLDRKRKDSLQVFLASNHSFFEVV